MSIIRTRLATLGLLAGVVTASLAPVAITQPAALAGSSAVLISTGPLCAANGECLTISGGLIISRQRHFLRGNEGDWQVWRVYFVSLKTVDPQSTKRSWIVRRSGDPVVVIRSVAHPGECAGYDIHLLVVPGSCSTFPWIIADGTLYGGFFFAGHGVQSSKPAIPDALTAIRGGSGLVILQPFTHSADQDW
jgi:hypothetical protein